MRTPSPRLLLIGSAAFAGSAVVALVPLCAAGMVGPAAAVQLAISLLILPLATMIAVSVRRTDGKALRIDTRTKRQDATLLRAERSLTRLAATLDGLTGQLDEAGRRRTGTVLAALGEDRMALAAQADRLAALENAMSAIEAGLSREVRQTYAQLEALIDVRALLRPSAPLPRLRGWAASPDVLRLLIGRVAAGGAKIIVECGSGSSSIWLGYAARSFGSGRVIALEHDERFAETSRDLVLAHGLQDVVEIRHAPLAPWTTGEEEIPWYDTRAVDDLTGIDLVFVDGPPGATAPMVRYPALPVLLPRCADDAWFVLDDAGRPAEREVAGRWLSEFPELTGVEHPAEKGALVLRRGPG